MRHGGCAPSARGLESSTNRFVIRGGARRRLWNSGYTVAELAVSAGVVALISTLLLVSSLAARRESLVRRAAEEFAGFLRETGGLTLNGVKAPGCGTEAACSVYRVRYFGNARLYTRRAFKSGATVTRYFLPRGTRFHTPTSTVRFQFTPPTLTTVPVSPVIQIRSRQTSTSGGTLGWQVCVTKSVSVVVLKEGLPCPP